MMRFSFLPLLMSACFAFAQTPTPMSEAADTGIEGVITVGPIHGGPVRPGIPSSKPLANATFVVGNETGQKGIGRYGPFDIDVTAGQMTKVEWQCDTGMR